jgi:hypothetical protein
MWYTEGRMMDFEKVLRFLIKEFQEQEVRYALIGGFALGAWGIVRATTDIDFLVVKDDFPRIENIMESHSYRCIFKSENVAQYFSEIEPFGSIDYLLAFRHIALSMLQRSVNKKLFSGELEIPTLLPEDIIGLKVQALANNPEREELEAGDIVRILEVYWNNVDWTTLKKYFILFNREKEYLKYETRFRKRDQDRRSEQ